MTAAPEVRLDPVESAVAELAAGRPVVVADDVHREDEGDVIIAAQHATAEWIAFLMTRCRGLICVAADASIIERLDLPPMTRRNADPYGTAFTVSVDAREGTTTGISAADRALTARRIADPASTPADFTVPGHLFPLRAVAGGVRERPGHTEAAVDLVRLAGLEPAGVICEIAGDDGVMLRGQGLRDFADEHGLVLVSIAELAAHLDAAPAPAPA